MDQEDDKVQLRSYSRRSRTRKRQNRNDQQQLYYLSDSEIGQSRNEQSDIMEDGLEETTVFSDSLYGDSLPSMRAQLAATQLLNRSRKKDLESSMGETRPLLGGDLGRQASKEELDTETSTLKESSVQPVSAELGRPNNKDMNNSGNYKSLGGNMLPQKMTKKEKIKKMCNYFKIVFLTLLIVTSVILFALNEENQEDYHIISLRNTESKSLNYTDNDIGTWKFITVQIDGPFRDVSYHNSSISNYYKNESCSDFIFVCGIPSNIQTVDNCPNEGASNCHSIELTEDFNKFSQHEHHATITKTLDMKVEDSRNIDVNRKQKQEQDDSNVSYIIHFMTENETPVEFQAAILGEKLSQNLQVIIAALILVWVYVLIAFDIVHRTIAAFIGSTCALAVLSMLDKRPTLEAVVEWIDLDTICLLFGMMTLVAIFSQTGFFDYSAVKAYKIARGKVWPLITLLCLFSAVVSAFLDNVTTILLLTPVSIRLCQVLNLDPRPILIAEVVFSNIGGTATAIGDPPNVIIVSNSLIRSMDITFPEFTLHLFLGIIPAMLSAYGLLSLIYFVSFIRVKNKDPPHVSELKREIAIWERTAQRLNVVSLEERAVRDAILAKAMDVRNQLNQEVGVSMHSSKDMWQKNLAELESKYRITNWTLLIKSSVVLTVVILMFFLSHIIPNFELELGWIAIFGAVVLLILSDIQDLESIIHKIEWGTLLFFAGLFILMEGLGELGLIRFIGQIMVSIISRVPEENQMMVAIIIILWISALASSFIDNIPFTTATIPVIWELAQSPDLCLSLRPLVWALAFGACLGGNGTLIGASANVVCAGIAEQNGYKISFMSFLKIGFPMMLITTLSAMVYLLLCHSAGDWDIDEDTKACVAAAAL